MMYPNLAAEVEAAQAVGEIELGWMANAAGVTVRLLREIIWGNEDATTQEAVVLFHWLSQNRGYDHFSMDYLLAPVLATVSPGTNKAKYRIVTLRKLLDKAESLAPAHWWIEQRKQTRGVLSWMERGGIVSYAAYRTSVALARHIIADREGAARRSAQRRDIVDRRAV